MHKIEVVDLVKEFKGSTVLDHINVELESGKIYGFIGKNGSGKTMLFRALGGLITPTQGKIIIDGKEVNEKNRTSNKIGLVIENASLYPSFSGFRNLMFLSKINQYIGKKEVKDAIKRVGLDPEDKRPVKKYSLGMKQRIAIAQAIMEKPDFLFLDEPTNGLDVEGIDLIRNVIKEEAKRGALVLIASHNKEDIELLCDEKYFMIAGKVSREEMV